MEDYENGEFILKDKNNKNIAIHNLEMLILVML